jgi:3-oxocholest-4-en-26-oate---CoA ligase
VIGCLKARTVPVNVNYNYTPHEVQELLDGVRPRAVIYHKSLGAKFADVFPPDGAGLLLSVDDGSPVSELPGAVPLDDALAQGDGDRDVTASPDDLLMICTGGTTGRPKGVLWRQSDIYVSSMVGADHASAQEIHDKVSGIAGAPWFAVSPLMHAAGMWTAFAAIMAGTTVVLYDTRQKLDPRSVWETAEREKVGMMTMVGDAYASPLVEELRRGRYDLSSLNAIGTGGAATNPKYQRALLELIPHLTLINGYGSSETGNMGFGHSHGDTRTDTFTLREGGLVLSEDYSHFLQPGEREIGWAAREGRIPLGYFNDADATRKTFPVVDGKRVVISGDRASLEEDGTLRLYGRDSLVVNTGGEKVFVEEVEEVLRAHPAIADALVVGRPSDRWGEELVALVELRDGADTTGEPLHAHCTSQLARFKAPKEYIFVEHVHRLGNGKADYRWAKTKATEKAPMST